MKKTWLLFTAILIFLCADTWAQSPGYWHLTDAEGLPSNTIYHIAENKEGYIFLGTAAGVARFNGFQFYTFENPDAKSADASNLTLDKTGNLWFSNFNHELFKINTLGIVEKIKSIDQTNFNAQGKFLLDKKSNVWFFNSDKIYNMISQTGKISSWKIDKTPFSFQLFGEKGIVAGFDEIFLFEFNQNYTNVSKKVIINLDQKIKTQKPGIYYNKVNQFITSSNFKWIKSAKEISMIDLNQYPKIKSVLNYGYLRNGDIWIATNTGFLLFDGDGKPRWNGNFILEGKNVSYVYQDSRNNFWVATLDEGLFMINNFEIETWHFYTDNHRLNGVSFLYSDKEEMLLGMQNGSIFRSVPGSNNAVQVNNTLRTVYFIGKLLQNKGYIINFQYFNKLQSKGIEITELSAPRGMIQLENEIVYSNNSGLRRWSESFLNNQNKVSDTLRFRMEIRNEKNELLDTSFQRVSYLILRGRGGKLFRDHSGKIWVNSSSGIYYLDWDKKIITHIKLSYNSNAMALDFAEDAAGNIYMAIANSGIVKWNENGIVKRYGVADGLLTSNARRLIWAGNRLWIATAKGLNTLDPVTGKFYDYRISDGLVSNDIQDITFFDQKIWVATFSGLNSIPVQYISENPNSPLLHISSVLVNGKEMISNPTGLKDLNYSDNNIEFRFEGINYKSRNLLYYSYRLIGQSDKWIRLDGNIGHVLFQGLPAGNYVFEIKSFNDKNISGNNLLRIPFKITEPVWKKTWFWLLTALAGAAILFVILRNRQADKVRKEKLENELRISQLASLKAQMNPHFMFNALNSIQDFILLNDKVSANTFLGKFSDLMRLVLDMSNQSYISLAHELKAINLYLELEALRFEDSMEYNLKIDEDLDLTDWKIPSMIIQPFVENAIKHGLLHKRSHRTLSLEFIKGEGGVLKVVIEDNGIGRKEAERINNSKGSRHASFATGATQKRLALLNLGDNENIKIRYEDLTDENGAAAGTRVNLTIPMISGNQMNNESPEFQ